MGSDKREPAAPVPPEGHEHLWDYTDTVVVTASGVRVSVYACACGERMKRGGE